MESFLAIGEATNMVFDSEFSIEAGPKIAKGRDVLFRIWRPYFVDRPNMHNGLHYEAQGDTSGNIRNGRVGAKETAHKRARGVSIKSNNHLPERDFIFFENHYSTLLSLLDGESDVITPGASLVGLRSDPRLIPIFRGWIDEGNLISVLHFLGFLQIKFLFSLTLYLFVFNLTEFCLRYSIQCFWGRIYEID